MKTALITGVTGQCGAYLSRLLLDNDYRVVGTSRDARTTDLAGLKYVGVADDVELCSLAYGDRARTEDLVDELRPDEIYHLASPSSVARSFQEPVETTDDIVMSTVNLLESIRRVDKQIRFFNAASTEMYGDCDSPVNEDVPLNPYSPYGVAKSAAFLQTRNYRQAYNMFACSGILSNFESPLRPANFVTRKIVSAANRIAAGDDITLKLGNVQIRRDWGGARDYVDAVWRMMQLDRPEDLVIATGKEHSLEDFLEFAFAAVGLNYRDHIEVDNSLLRPLDIKRSVGDPSRAARALGWRARTSLKEVVAEMVDAETELTRDKYPRLTNLRNVAAFPVR